MVLAGSALSSERARYPGLQMTAPSPTLAARPADWQPWLTVVLPFTALGLLPWWVCLSLSAALALGRLNEDARSVAPLLVLLGAVAVSLPLLFGTGAERLVYSGTLFAEAVAVGLLALASARALNGGQRRGFLAPVAGLLLFPSAGGLLALLLAGLGTGGADARPRLQIGRTPLTRALRPVLVAALLVSGLALLLGPVFPALPATVSAPAAATRQRPVAPAPARPSGPLASGQRQTTPTPAATGLPSDPLLIRPLIPVTALLIVLCCVLLLQRTRLKRAERRSTWADYAALLAMLCTLFMVGVLGAGAKPGGFLSGPPPAPADLPGIRVVPVARQAARHLPDWVAPLLNASMVVATLFFAVAAVYLYRALRDRQKELQTAAPAAATLPGTPPLPPLHRVRLAWRGLEAALGTAGLARLGSETPEDYAARLAGLLPAAGGDLHTLTRLYLPVRYGGELSEHDADSAEAALLGIRAALGTQDTRGA